MADFIKNREDTRNVKEFTATQIGINGKLEDLIYWYDETYEFLYRNLYKRSYKQRDIVTSKSYDSGLYDEYKKQISDKCLRQVLEYFANRDNNWKIAKENFEQFEKVYRSNEENAIKKYQLLQKDFPRKRTIQFWK